MKNLVRKIKELVNGWNARMEMRRRCRLVEESVRRIQVMEFGGIIHICFDGVPLIEEGWLKDGASLVDRLEDVRGTWRLWYEDLRTEGLERS